MKVLFVIVQHDDASPLINALVKAGHRTTRYASSGGFLRRGNATFLIGVEDEQLDGLLGLIRETCRPRTAPLAAAPRLGPQDYGLPFPVEVRVGGATVFVLPADGHIRV